MSTNSPVIELQYVAGIEEIIWGVVLVALTLGIHSFGMLWTLRFSNAFKARFAHQPAFAAGMFKLILASWLIMLVHIVEIIMWAGFFQWKHCFVNFSTAGYFALNEYTTVGSSFNLPLNWRLLEGMIATAGLLGFAWSTAVLLALAQEFQDQQMQLLKQQRQKHALAAVPAPLLANKPPNCPHVPP
jgi:hypothetical protein